MTTLQTINASASPEVQQNENTIALSPAGMFGNKATTTTGLTWGYYGGILFIDGVATSIADGTTLLTASQTNYVERTRAGVVSDNTTGFTAGQIPLYTVVTSASGITSYVDHRDFGIQLQKGRVAVTVTTADVTLTAAQARVDEIAASGTLTGNRSIIVPTVAWAYIVNNATAGAFTLTVKTAAGAGVEIAQGTSDIVYCDGTDVKRAFSGATFSSLTLTGPLTMSGTAANIATGANFISYAGTDAGLSFDASNNATLSGTLAAVIGTFTKATAGDSILFTNGGATPKTGYLYSNASTIGLFSVANASGAGFWVVTETSATMGSPNQATTLVLTDGVAAVTAASTTLSGTLTVSGATVTTSGIYIGVLADANLIDDASIGAGSTTLYIGNASINVTSDERVKENVRLWEGDASSILRDLPVKTWDRYLSDAPMGGYEGGYVGFTAQDLREAAPWAVNTQGDTGLPWQARYEFLNGIIVKGWQDHEQRIQQLTAENAALTSKINRLENRNA